MKPLSECALYTFVDTSYLHGRSPQEVARQMCEGGADLIQLRAKGVPAAQIQRWAEMLLPITEGAGVGLVINDQPLVAVAVRAPFCHLGQEDFFGAGFTQVTQVLPAPSSVRLGLSSHAPEQAQRAVAAGAHYVGIGPVFATPTKSSVKPVTLEYVRWAAAHLDVPWFAIGGLTLDNLDEVLMAGARRVAVVSAILNAPDIVQACQKFKARLSSARL